MTIEELNAHSISMKSGMKIGARGELFYILNDVGREIGVLEFLKMSFKYVFLPHGGFIALSANDLVLISKWMIELNEEKLKKA